MIYRSEDDVLVADTDDRVRTITLNRPSRLNAFTSGTYRRLAHALGASATSEHVHVVVLRGAGRAFSSGVDLDRLADTDPDELRDAFAELLRALIDFPKPLLAAVHGVSVGFGMTILLHADIVVVAEDARLQVPFAQLGVAPEAASSVLLPARVGSQRAEELLFTGRWVLAEEAVELGLAVRSCPTGELAEVIACLAREIAARSPGAVAAAKALMRAETRPVANRAAAREAEVSLRLGQAGYPRRQTS